MKHTILLLYTWLIRSIFIIFPDQPIIMRCRGYFYGLGMPDCGKDFQVSASTVLRNLENIYVGDNVYLAPNVIINAIASVTLGEQVMIGFNSVLVSGNHTLLDNSYRYGKSKVSPIIIGNGSWIGANCTVTAGTELGGGCLVAANSAISGSCLKQGIYGGVPARKLK